jgi:hypothetical protein
MSRGTRREYVRLWLVGEGEIMIHDHHSPSFAVSFSFSKSPVSPLRAFVQYGYSSETAQVVAHQRL